MTSEYSINVTNTLDKTRINYLKNRVSELESLYNNCQIDNRELKDTIDILLQKLASKNKPEIIYTAIGAGSAFTIMSIFSETGILRWILTLIFKNILKKIWVYFRGIKKDT